MIGGYIFQQVHPEILQRVQAALTDTFQRIPCGEHGFLFYDTPYTDLPTGCATSERLTLLSQDLLVAGNAEQGYAALDLNRDLPDLFERKQTDVFQDIVSDYRLIVVDRRQTEMTLYLVSHRAGNGRMYHAAINSGLLFASDIRFLLRVLPLTVNEPAVYALLKYGGVPEPMTISQNIAVVPPAHYLRYNVRTGVSQTHAYFQFEFPCDDHPTPPEQFDALLQPVKHALRQSARALAPYHPAILLSGGIDSSLYAMYLHEVTGDRMHGLNCAFGEHDPEHQFARMVADKVQAQFHIGQMQQHDALALLQDTVALTGHPFGDFSSLPIVFMLKFMKSHVPEAQMLIEGNGADDCFGFADLGHQAKFALKHRFPKIGKDLISTVFRNSKHWKWQSHEGLLARVLALSDDHERNLLNYFLVYAPTNFLGLNAHQDWDRLVTETLDWVVTRCGKNYPNLSYKAKLTIRQLLHINSRQWAAKAFSVGESLGIRVIYPYIWRDILHLQGTIPWQAKIHQGVVKWPLKRLLEEFMPQEFIYRPKSGFVPPFVQWLTTTDFNQTVRDVLLASDGVVQRIVPPRLLDELLADALRGERLRFPVLNFLWAALFTEMWIQKYRGK